MDSTPSNPKKRKRDHEQGGNTSLKLSVVPSTNSELGPVLVSFPALQPPKDTAFQAYRAKASTVENGAQLPMLVKGETEAVEFRSMGIDHPELNFSCEYMIGVYDKSTNTVRLHRAPTYVMGRTVKRLKSISRAAITAAPYMEARTQLGETFGSKKAIKAIRAAERNRVDVSAMEGVTSFIQSTIDSGTSALPTEEQAKAEADISRPIPPVNVDAKSPAGVYNVHDIALEAELNEISVSPLIAAVTLDDRIALLPHSRSNWVNKHIRQLFEAEKLSKSSLKQLVFISCMFAFKYSLRSLEFGGRELVERRLEKVMPSSIVDGLFSRFTVSARGDPTPKVTTEMETRLLTHMFALCLRLDNFSVETGVLAGDLSMPQKNVNKLFQALGCKMVLMSNADREHAGLTMVEAREQRKAVLKLPLTFPKMKGGARKK